MSSKTQSLPVDFGESTSARTSNSIEFKELNMLLKELATIGERHGRGTGTLLSFVEERPNHIGVPPDSNGEQGEYNSYYYIYKVNSRDNLYLIVEYITDSYGSGRMLNEIQFAQQKPIQKVDYVAI